MSVLEAFGQNLRNLTELRGSQAFVAKELGINRVQFGRYLRSESYPKPNLLKKICDYFGVDARIMTEVLARDELAFVAAAGPGRECFVVGKLSAMEEAVAYCIPDQTYFDSDDDLPDGIYQMWRRAFSRPDCAARLLIRVFTLKHARVARGFEARSTFFDREHYRGPQREFRGMLLKQRVGYVIVFFQREPSRVVSLDYLAPVDAMTGSFAAGFSVVARAAQPDGHRVGRCAVSRITNGWPEIMRIARMPTFVAWDDVPEQIKPYILPENESF